MSENRLRQLNIDRLNGFDTLSLEKENLKLMENARVIFITQKKKVVAHAKWQQGNLVITNVRRQNKRNLKVGQVLYEGYRPQEIPPAPEFKTSGWQLTRMSGYDSSKTKRQDPFWHQYEGWFLIPETVDGKPGEDALMDDYSDKLIKNDVSKLGIVKSGMVDPSQLKMALYSEVDAYVMGTRDQVPELLPFVEPAQNDMVVMAPIVCYCGCGKMEGWHRYWTNRWVVYKPRERKANEVT